MESQVQQVSCTPILLLRHSTLRPLSAVPSIFRLLASFRGENLSGDSDSHVGLRVEPMLCFPGTRRSSGFHLFSCHASRRAGRNAFLDQPCGPSAPLVWHGLCHVVLSTATLFTATLRSSQKLAGGLPVCLMARAADRPSVSSVSYCASPSWSIVTGMLCNGACLDTNGPSGVLHVAPPTCEKHIRWFDSIASTDDPTTRRARMVTYLRWTPEVDVSPTAAHVCFGSTSRFLLRSQQAQGHAVWREQPQMCPPTDRAAL